MTRIKARPIKGLAFSYFCHMNGQYGNEQVLLDDAIAAHQSLDCGVAALELSIELIRSNGVARFEELAESWI